MTEAELRSLATSSPLPSSEASPLSSSPDCSTKEPSSSSVKAPELPSLLDKSSGTSTGGNISAVTGLVGGTCGIAVSVIGFGAGFLGMKSGGKGASFEFVDEFDVSPAAYESLLVVSGGNGAAGIVDSGFSSDLGSFLICDAAGVRSPGRIGLEREGASVWDENGDTGLAGLPKTDGFGVVVLSFAELNAAIGLLVDVDEPNILPPFALVLPFAFAGSSLSSEVTREGAGVDVGVVEVGFELAELRSSPVSISVSLDLGLSATL